MQENEYSGNAKQEHWGPGINGQMWSSASVKGAYKGEP